MEEFYDKFSAAWKNPVESNIITTGYHINEKAFAHVKITNLGFNWLLE